MEFQSIVEIDGPKMAWVQVWDDEQRQLLYYKIRYSGKDVIKLASQLSVSIIELKRKVMEKAKVSGVHATVIWRTWPAITTVTNEDGHPVAFIASFRAGTIPELDEEEWAAIGPAKDARDDQINRQDDPNQRIKMPTPLNVSYDAESDVLTIDGLDYAGDVFRNFAKMSASHLLYEVWRIGNQCTIELVHDTEAQQRGREWNKSFDEAYHGHGD